VVDDREHSAVFSGEVECWLLYNSGYVCKRTTIDQNKSGFFVSFVLQYVLEHKLLRKALAESVNAF
jgi:hypothetical protein